MDTEDNLLLMGENSFHMMFDEQISHWLSSSLAF